MELVSVIIPNYNHADYLKERIDSVLNQSYQNFEVIILDDKSKDASISVIEQYRNHEKIAHIVYNESNSGSTFKQWEKGLSLAKGDWIWIAESDDVADPEFLESLAKEITPSTGIVFCRSNLIDEKNQNIHLYGFSSMPDPSVYHEFGSDFKSSGDDFVQKYMLSMNAIPNASSAIFRKSFVNVEIFKEAGKTRLFGDWLFWLHVLSQSDISFIHQAFNHFRFHQNTVRKDTLLSSTRLMEYRILVRYLEREYKFADKALDCLVYLYLSGEIPRSRLTFSEHFQLISFIFVRKPFLLVKSYFRKLTK